MRRASSKEEIMAGGLDDLLNKAVPGGLSKPLMIALGTLLVGKMVGGAFGGASDNSAASSKPQSDPTLVPRSGADAGALGGLGGLGDLLKKLTDAGHDDKVDSWVGPGQNKPIEPHQIGTALGPKTVSDVAKQSGMSEQDLLSQLAQALPGVINQLTPNGRLPTMQELGNILSRGLQTTAR
jgi:uncharacterized protein YidB (DUF937 family)